MPYTGVDDKLLIQYLDLDRLNLNTEAYADDTFFHRPGREDALDVREEIIKRSREEIPDYAKKYSR